MPFQTLSTKQSEVAEFVITRLSKNVRAVDMALDVSSSESSVHCSVLVES